MDIERLKELADCDVFIGGNPIVADRAQETLRTLIDEAIETETTGCHYCWGIESHGADVGGEKEKRNAREWERMVDAYGTLEGWLCPCGFSSAGAWNYCPSCGSEMYGGEKLMSALTPLGLED